MKLLVIRPQPGNDASAKRARDAGFDVTQLPFFEIASRPWAVPDAAQFDALLISSANAVRHAGSGLAQLQGLPVHAVGSNSAEAAEAAGLHLASSGTGGVVEAIETAKSLGHQRLVWLAGEDMTAVEAPQDVLIEPRTVYASEPVRLPHGARATVADADVVALHSARAAQHFAAFVDKNGLARSNILLAAFSAAIARAAGAGWGGIAVAEGPDDQALLSAARLLVKQAHQNRSQGEKG